MPLNILLVEDSADDAELLAIELSAAGLDVTWQRIDDQSALRKLLSEGKQDLVISDLSLPGFSGLDVLQQVLRADPDLPLVFFSGSDEHETMQSALDAGASAFVSKERMGQMPGVICQVLGISPQPRN